jgi:hypothetical protein
MKKSIVTYGVKFILLMCVSSLTTARAQDAQVVKLIGEWKAAGLQLDFKYVKLNG